MLLKNARTSLIFIGIAFLSIYLGSCQHKSSKNQTAAKPTLDFSPPEEIQVSLPINSTSFPFSFIKHHYLIAPFAESSNQGLSIASGWGYMAPQIASFNGNQYWLMYFSCDEIVKNFYCLYLVKNGSVISSVHGMGLTIPNSVNAYQPPLLFIVNSNIVVIYEVGLSNGASMITSVYADLTKAEPLLWKEGTAFTTSQGTLNYLGGALAPDNMIHIVGLDLEDPSHPALSLVSLNYNSSTWSDKKILKRFDNKSQTPVYPHVQVRKNGELEILFTLLNNLPCDEDGQRYSESYKTVQSIRGLPDHPFSTTFSNSSNDVSINNPGGDSCLYHKQRFPMAQFYDYENDVVYSVIKSSNVPVIISNNKVKSNLTFERNFLVYANGSLVKSNLEEEFQSYFPKGNQIWSIGGTILANGTKVFAAANDGLISSFNEIAFISTQNLEVFSDVYLLEAPDLPGHSIHFVQPYKNGSTIENYLEFFHSGTVFGDRNNHHKFNFYKSEFIN